MPDEIIQPLHVYRPDMPKWTVAEAAKLIADPSLPEATARSHIRNLAQRKLIHVAGLRGSGPTASNLYGPADVAAAKVLSVLTDLGMDAADTIGRVSPSLYGWQSDQPIGQGHPVVAAMFGADRAEWWILHVKLLRGDQKGTRQVRAWIYDPAKWAPSGEAQESEMLPRASVTVHLLPLLLPLHRRIMADIGATSVRAH